MAAPNGGFSELSTATDSRRSPFGHGVDVLIIGAGVLGCALSVMLSKQGRRVLLVESSMKEPDRIVGELMQPGGVRALEQLGLRGCLDDIDAIRVDGYHISYFGRPVRLQYPRDGPSSPRPEGRAFHHGRFVMKLRAAALACPNVTVIEAKAVKLITDPDTGKVCGVECAPKDSDTNDCYFAHLTVVANGYASKLRERYHPHRTKARSKFYGLELIDAKLPSPCHGHVILSDAPPVLIYQIGTHETRILIDVPDNLPSASVQNGGVKTHLRNVVLPLLPDTVQPSFLAALESGRLRSMPNSFLPASKNKTPGLLILGDALNMRHPLTGGGMTVALNDVVILRELLSPENVPDLSDTARVLKQLSEFHWQRKKSASVINILAQALYSLFAANDQYLRALQRGCFRYFELGRASEPMGLLGGLIKQPLVLVRHFYTVAFLSVWLVLKSTPLYMLPVSLARCTRVFWTACVVILPYVFIEAWN